PLLVRLGLQIRVLHLQPDVLEVIAESGASQPLDVFKNEGAWLGLADSPDGFRKHVAIVGVGAMLAAKRERLAGWPTGPQVDLTFVPREIDVVYIALRQRPVGHVGDATGLVLADGVTAVAVPFDHLKRVETGLVQSQSQSAGAGEELDGLHGPRN